MAAHALPYDELFRSNPLPMWVYDPGTLRFLDVNDAAIVRYGWTRDEFLAMSIEDIRPSGDVPALRAEVASLPSHSPRGRAWRHVTKQGEEFEVEIASHAFAHDGHDARLVVAHDVTAQEAARLSEERFRLVARATMDAIWDWDLVTGALWWNEGAAKLFGALPGAPSGTVEDWIGRLHPDDRDRVVNGIQAVIRGSGAEWGDEYRYRRADDSYAVVADRGFVLRAEDGTPLRMVGGMTDLTERRELEARMLRAQRMEGIGTLAGGIAHDLNNMLSPILMSIDLLRAHVSSTEGQGVLGTIEASAKRGADLVRQVLTYARGVDGQRDPLAVRGLLEDVRRTIASMSPPQMSVELDVPEGIWPVAGDSAQLHQVFMNLLVNARDAMPSGGTVGVHAANAVFSVADAATIEGAHAGRYVRITVADTGTGMSDRVRERIFEPFFTTKDVGKGTGLGLSTVHAIVRSHAGFITVRSAPGKGSTFDVHLPADPRPVASAAPPRRLTPVRGVGQLVLVVDDEPHIRQFIARLLERKGYRVVSAADGEEAVGAFAEHRDELALLLTDMQMPGLDGRAVIRHVRRVAPGLPVIAMSGLEPPAAPAGDDDASWRDVLHLMKPFSGDQLDTCVRRAISQR